MDAKPQPLADPSTFRLEELRVRELEVEKSMRSEQQRKTYLEEEARKSIEERAESLSPSMGEC